MIIETERLILRPFLEGDAADVYEYLKAPAVNCFAGMRLRSLDEAQEAVQKRLGETEYYFAITLKDGGKVIGEIDAYPETGEAHAGEDAVRDTFSPCWMLNKNYQGKGYAFEAAHAFFDYLFSQKGARRIYAYTEDYNLSSQHLCEKLGMRREGLFLEFVSFVNHPDGTPKYENTVQYAILKKRVGPAEVPLDSWRYDMGAASVSEYVASLNEEQRRHVIAFMDFMRAEYPQLTPKISFSMPMWLLGKKMYEGYVAVSAAKNHFSIHFSDEEFLNRLAESLPACKKGKRCINIK